MEGSARLVDQESSQCGVRMQIHRRHTLHDMVVWSWYLVDDG